MSNYQTLLEYSRPEYVRSVSATRDKDQGILRVSLKTTASEGRNSIELSGFDELARAVSDLLAADQVVISKEVNSGKEFGTIKIECRFDGDLFEYRCDAAS